jgi:hypothetical protein
LTRIRISSSPFKLINTKVTPVSSDYVIVDFKCQLIPGAGFEVDRIGVVSITSVGNAVQVLWTATTAARYKKMETIMRDIAASFRCYADGLDLSDELSAY